MKKAVSLVICLLLIIGIVPISASAETTFITQDGITYKIDTTTGEAEVDEADAGIVTDDIPSEINGYPVTSIGDYAFEYCTLLTEITIPDSVTSIGDRAFYYCRSLTSVTIPDSVTSIGGSAFDNTAYYNDETNWENGVLYIGSYLIDAKTNISDEYTIKDGTKVIADNAFTGCASLTSVTIPDSVTSIGDQAFYYTAYYNDETNWKNGVLYLGNYLIDANSNISGKYTIKDGTKLIADYAFSWCESLTKITIPDSVTSIGERAFYCCTSLTSVTIPDSVTSIGNWAFEDCTSLTSVTIPDSVTSIGDYAFGYYFDDSGYIHKIENFTIYGYTGSAAETYANENDFTFISIGDMPEPPTTQGDLNGDNIISIVDARLALVAVVSGNASDEDTAIADFNGDGKLSIVDVRLLLVKIANGEV